MEREKQRRQLQQAAMHAATALIALKLSVRLVRAAGKALLSAGGGGKRVAPEPQSEAPEEGPPGAAATAREQWQQCQVADAPPSPPEGARLVASADLPISVYQFYEQFVSVETTCLQDHHQAPQPAGGGQTDFRGSRWKPDASGGLSRVFTFVQPKKGVISAPASCVQKHRLSAHPGGVLSLTTDMRASGIPYGDCFRVQSFWTVRPDPAAAAGCRVEIRVAVPFDRGCIMRGVITNASMSDCKKFFSSFLEKAARAAGELAPSPGARAGAPGVSPFAGAAMGGADGEVLVTRPGPAARRTLSASAKASFRLPPPPAAWPPTRLLVHLHTLLLAVVLLVQALLLLELSDMRRRLGGVGGLSCGGGPSNQSAAAGPLAGALEAARWAAGAAGAGPAAHVNGAGLGA